MKMERLALEGFFIELLAEDVAVSPTDVDVLLTLGKQYKLDRASVFDPKIWMKVTRQYAP